MTAVLSPVETAALAIASVTRTAADGELDCVVERRDEVAEGVVSLVLRAADGGALPAWTAGAHIDLVLTGTLVRQYSLCGSPSDRRRWRIAVLREPVGRGGSLHVHEVLRRGATVRVRGPRNHFPLQPSPRHLFIAGGIGITPILPMIEAAARAGSDWRLVYGGRRRASMAFLDELAGRRDRVQLVPEDELGRIDLDGLLGTPRDGTLVYCCGPEPLLAAVEERCAGWPAGSLQVERFSARPVDSTPAAAFELVLERSGITLTVPPDRSILDVCEAAGVSMLAS
ncbi:MAG TPA: ferredoxin reductase, partial [Candidatus Dormibacteraeota bacterium]|nr:ferredoxin reductase [Candidatus Dormibacteraeota bacterium]